MNAWTEVHSAPSQKVSMLTELGMPKPATRQSKDEEENKTPRTNWNSEGAFLKRTEYVLINYFLREKEEKTNKQTPTGSSLPRICLTFLRVKLGFSNRV